MKLKYVLTLAIIAFLAVSIYSGIKLWKAKRVAEKLATLETEYSFLKKEKESLTKALAEKEIEYGVLYLAKSRLQNELIKERADTQKKILEYESTITGLLSIPADTVYKVLFDRWGVLDGVLKYRFAENQIRGLYLTVIQKDHFEGLYTSTNKSLLTCMELNTQNDLVIGNLNDQNGNLRRQGLICNEQNSTLQEELKITSKQLNKAKRNGWMAKGVAVLGWVAFVFK